MLVSPTDYFFLCLFVVPTFKPLFPFQVRPCGVGEGAAYHLGVKFTCQEVAMTI